MKFPSPKINEMFPLIYPETELSTPETPGDRIEEFAVEEPVIRPYETRALNYLVNEYLLLNDYKLTSVTFAEENEDQVCMLCHYI